MSNIHHTTVTPPAPTRPQKPAREPIRLSPSELRQIVLEVMG